MENCCRFVYLKNKKTKQNKTVSGERLGLGHRQNVNLAIKTNIYLTGFAKTWLKKFQVHFNNLTSNWKGKQLKVTS